MSKIVYILEDEYSLRSTLSEYLKQKGYQVYAFSDPSFCPLSDIPDCKCTQQTPCTNFIITDINMPSMTGLKFIEGQKSKGCIAPHVAIMSATWSEEEYQEAKSYGCKVFEKPFSLTELLQWMKNCEKETYVSFRCESSSKSLNMSN